MPVIVFDLADDEDIVRIYSRYPKQTQSFQTLLAKDFARKMDNENGISLLRISPGFFSEQQALNYVRTIKLKGLATCKASVLKNLNLIFMADSATDEHFTARCPGCNLNPNPRPILCKPKEGQVCTLDLQAEPSLAQDLSDLCRILVPIV